MFRFQLSCALRALFCALGAPMLVASSAYAQTPIEIPEILVTTDAVPGSFPPPVARPAGQTLTTIDTERFKAKPVFSVTDILQDSPGVSVKQGNGPRDIGISIRGSNARNGFGVRNVVVFEDGFPVTQPDGLSRTDLVDPHAYGGVDVYRGPSSALFGNYATGGALNFRLRQGRDINGFEYGVDAGSFGFVNNYLLSGRKFEMGEGTVFLSDARGDGALSHSKFDTQTINAIGHYALTPDDTITVKAINNNLSAQLPLRQSLNQFRLNPYQRNCNTVATAAPGCPTVALSGVQQTADQGGFNRDDRRSIGGLRWEHRFDNDTTWRTQYVFDDRNINQPTGTTSAVGDFPSHNVISDLTRRGQLFGLETTTLGAVFFNTMKASSDTINVLPGGNATLGTRVSNTATDQYNAGARVRQEIQLDPRWTFAYGAGAERSHIEGLLTPFTGAAVVSANRDFDNLAPEAGLKFRASDEWLLRARVAAGYGIPQAGNLFVTPAGLPGANTALQPQRNVGYDLGADWTPNAATTVSLTGFYETFENELLAQSAGPGLMNFTFNAPRSIHQGIELAVDWRFQPGWRLVTAYTYNDQYFSEFSERLTAGAVSRSFDRAGNKIPGVSPNELTARLGYDETAGRFAGAGAFVEIIYKDSFFLENGNIVKAPGYQVVNLNVHYDRSLNDPIFKGFTVFTELRNAFDREYVASANNITNTINAAGAQNSAATLANTSGSIYAGPPRTVFAGMKLRF